MTASPNPREEGQAVEPLRMDAYYYSFDATGVREVDLILSAVACAGKAAHHTDSWSDNDEDDWSGYYPPHTGRKPRNWIQNAAQQAAADFASMRARAERAETDLVVARAMHRDCTFAAEEQRARAEQAERERDEYREEVAKYARDKYGEDGLLDRLESAERELAEARKDAERYRWLRDNEFGDAHDVWLSTRGYGELDGLIDQHLALTPTPSTQEA